MCFRITFALLTCTIICPFNLTNSFSGFKLTSYDGKRLEEGHCFQNITERRLSSCFQRCLSNCLCTSFQLCSSTTNMSSTCQLFSGDEGRQGALRDQEGCSYFNFTAAYDETILRQQCQHGCVTGINCCLTSQPCFNGGTCVPQYSTAKKSRFTCECNKNSKGKQCQDCIEGYTGHKCETRIRSCRGYINGSQIANTYKIFKDDKLYPVKCDFDKDRKQAWTLVQSFKFGNHDTFKTSMVRDKPIRQEDLDFKEYRLSRSRMEEIAKDSSKWRITCDYIEGHKISYTDYVEASLSKVDILTFNGNKCVEVDYIDIRGHNCSKCSAYMVQSHNKEVNRFYMGLHFDSTLGPQFSCQHNATEGSHTCGKSGEDDFGFFDCFNKKHRCSAHHDSLTSTWFGG